MAILETVHFLCCPQKIPPGQMKRRFKKASTVVGIVTLILTIVSAALLTEEMVRANQFYTRSMAVLHHKDKNHYPQLHDRDGRNITLTEMKELLAHSYTERGLMTVFLCTEILMLFACAGLIRAGFVTVKQCAVPYLGILPVTIIIGSCLIIIDSVRYTFHTENLAIFIFWFLSVIIQCLLYRIIIMFYKRLASAPCSPRVRATGNTQVTERRRSSQGQTNNVFVITTPSSSSSTEIIMRPPSYDDIMANADYIKPPPDDGQEAPTEKPPDYDSHDFSSANTTMDSSV